VAGRLAQGLVLQFPFWHGVCGQQSEEVLRDDDAIGLHVSR
jgi:hypothetical protein